MRPALEQIAELEDGALAEELSLALNHVIQEVMTARRGGSVVLKIHVAPNGENSIEVRGEVEDKAPRAPRRKTIMFVDPSGNMRRDNPAQPRLPLREVASTPVREING